MAAEVCDLTLPQHPKRWCCSQLCTDTCTQCMKETKKWSGWKLLLIAGVSGRAAPRPQLHESAWKREATQGGMGKAWHGAEGWVATFSFSSSSYYLSSLKTFMQPQPHLLFCGTSSVGMGVPVKQCPSWLGTLPGADCKSQQIPSPSFRVLICGIQSSCLNLSTLSVSIVFYTYSMGQLETTLSHTAASK